jgi:prepilin-type N-terminal cleavage/methylation domain-containing protein
MGTVTRGQRFQAQSGMTLVELILAMALTAVVLTALVGVVFGANLVTSTWGQRTYLSETAQLLPSSLQADTHRYVPCSGQPAGTDLHLCLPGGPEMVTYSSGPSCPCDLLRTDRQIGSVTLVVRGLEAPVAFAASCTTEGAVDRGSVSISVRYHGDAAPQPPVQVFFKAPAGSCAP